MTENNPITVPPMNLRDASYAAIDAKNAGMEGKYPQATVLLWQECIRQKKDMERAVNIPRLRLVYQTMRRDIEGGYGLTHAAVSSIATIIEDCIGEEGSPKAIEQEAREELAKEQRRADIEKAKQRLRERRWWHRLFPFRITFTKR